jgi:outer membrane PBP1 activator LpoA protein
MMFKTGALRLFPPLLASLWLAACATPEPAKVAEPNTYDKAETAEFRGQYERAADLWLQLANESPPSAAAAFRLRAAEAWNASGQTQYAYELLTDIRPDTLSSSERSRFYLLRTEKALSEADLRTAQADLDLAGDGLDPALEPRFLALQQTIHQRRAGSDQYRLLSAISSDLGPSGAFSLAQALDLLRTYEYVPSGSLLEAAAMQSLDPRAASWAALMARVRSAVLRSDRLELAAEDWRSDYPGHEVDTRAFLEIAFMYGQRFTAPANVSVMLPMEGRFSAAGSAIRDGLLGAYLAQPGLSELTFIDSGDRPMEALTAFRESGQNRPDWIIGPVRKESVQAVAELGPTGVGVLALNDLDAAPEAHSTLDFFTLSLSQEAEARAIAAKMLEAGATRAITLITDSNWGRRIEAAFAEAFIQGGGQISDIARFSTANSDHSEELIRALQIDQSRVRRDELQSLLGVNLSFEPQPRNDFDAFFLSSMPELARQLRPQLRFFEVGAKPVFALGRVYSGTPDTTADRDLNGIILPLTAAEIGTSAEATVMDLDSMRRGRQLPLYALGRDAWNLLRWLPLLQLDPDLAFPGDIGNLRLDSTGRLVRDPSWAVFSGGRPVPYVPVSPTE